MIINGIHNQRGFTLLEVLVTIVIVSIGLLGLLGLQTVSLVNTQISAARSQASIAADNMADRIRANPQAAADGYYDNISHPAAGSAPDPQCIKGAICSPSQMAAFDVWEWDRSLANYKEGGQRITGLLPDGAGYIDCEEKHGSHCVTYRVTIAWRERDSDYERINGHKSEQCDYEDLPGRCFSTLVRP